MLYRLLTGGLFILGCCLIFVGYMGAESISPADLWQSTFGVSLVLISIINYVFLYESHSIETPKYILLTTNGFFIGYLMLLISIKATFIPAIISAGIILVCSILVLNRKV